MHGQCAYYELWIVPHSTRTASYIYKTVAPHLKLCILDRVFVKSSLVKRSPCKLTYIRPHLEYCTPAWSPFLAKDIDIIEKVQHRSTKLVAALADLPYEDRLRHLDLHSLYCRRQRADLITIYKLLHNKIQIDSSYFFTLNTFTTTRGHDYKLYKTQTRLHLRQNFFSNRTVTLWNNLPNYIVAANDINQFKNKLDNYWRINRYGHIQRP